MSNDFASKGCFLSGQGALSGGAVDDNQTVLNLRTIIDKMPGGFFIYRADGDEEIVYINKAMLRIFNCDTMEEFKAITGNSFRGIVHPDDLDEVEKSIEQQSAKGGRNPLDRRLWAFYTQRFVWRCILCICR